MLTYSYRIGLTCSSFITGRVWRDALSTHEYTTVARYTVTTIPCCYLPESRMYCRPILHLLRNCDCFTPISNCFPLT